LESDDHVVVDVGLQRLHRVFWVVRLFRVFRFFRLERVFGILRFVGLFRRLLRRGLEFDAGLHGWHDGERERNQLSRELVDAG
jgi:hypothetical protein